MNIKDYLVLDHFYITVKPGQFEKYKEKFPKIFNSCRYAHVKSGKDSWKGVYLFAKNKTYFEILRSYPGCFQFGIALSVKNKSPIDSDSLVKQFPDVKWDTRERANAEGKPWFTAYNLPRKKEIHPQFIAWAMKYHIDRDKRMEKQVDIPNCSVKQFSYVYIKVPAKFISSIIPFAKNMLPGKHEYSLNKYILNIPNRTGGIFKIIFEVDSKLKNNIEPIELCGKMNKRLKKKTNKVEDCLVSQMKTKIDFLWK